jgi:hypothetical protein
MDKKQIKKKLRSIISFLSMIVFVIVAMFMFKHFTTNCPLTHETACECVLCLENLHADFCRCDLCSKLDKIDEKHLANCKYIECVVEHKEDCHNANCICKCPTCDTCKAFDKIIDIVVIIVIIFLIYRVFKVLFIDELIFKRKDKKILSEMNAAEENNEKNDES